MADILSAKAIILICFTEASFTSSLHTVYPSNGERENGGSQGSGSSITPEGEFFILQYRKFEQPPYIRSINYLMSIFRIQKQLWRRVNQSSHQFISIPHIIPRCFTALLRISSRSGILHICTSVKQIWNRI